jgi:hypothetical protein
MHDITKHYSEEEWERNDCEHSWINFLIRGDTISIYDLLESPCNFIELVVSRLYQFLVFFVSLLNCESTLKSFTFYKIIDCSLEIIRFWTPNKTLEKGSLSLKHIEISVDCLFSHDKQFVKLENRYVSLLSCISIYQEFFV